MEDGEKITPSKCFMENTIFKKEIKFSLSNSKSFQVGKWGE